MEWVEMSVRWGRISGRVKHHIYKTEVRPALVYGLETVELAKRQEAELEVAELKMLRLLSGVTRMDTILIQS